MSYHVFLCHFSWFPVLHRTGLGNRIYATSQKGDWLNEEKKYCSMISGAFPCCVFCRYSRKQQRERMIFDHIDSRQSRVQFLVGYGSCRFVVCSINRAEEKTTSRIARTSSETKTSRFCNDFLITPSHYACKMHTKYPRIKLISAVWK